MMNQFINDMVNYIVVYSNITLMPIMCATFLIGGMFRWLLYWTVQCELNFTLEFEKRVHKYLARDASAEVISSFHQLTKKVLENTYYEIFELKRKYKRRRFDSITVTTDRVFLIQEGVARLIRDTLSQTKYLKREGRTPRFLDVAKFVYGANPVFNRVFGVLPMGLLNELLNILPGLFVIGGIFGTFVGIMQALPELSHLNLNDIDASKVVMDKFLINMAFSMGTSIVGIVFSVGMTILNAVYSPDSLYVTSINKFTSSLEFLWNDTITNEVAAGHETIEEKNDRRAVRYSNTVVQTTPQEAEFNEPKDPLEVETSYRKALYEKAHMTVLPKQEREIREIESRIKLLEVYMKMAYQDKMSNLIPEDLWQLKQDQWMTEKLDLEEKLKAMQRVVKAA